MDAARPRASAARNLRLPYVRNRELLATLADAQRLRYPYMAFTDLAFQTRQPPPALAEFVESFWLLVNHSDAGQPVVIVPDGRVDVFFSYSATEPFHALLLGLDTQPDAQVIPPQTRIFAISWQLLGADYLLPIRLADMPQHACHLPLGYLGISAADLTDFASFCAKATDQIQQLLPAEIDRRKRKLFSLIYATHGTLTVEAYADAAAWSSRQINRYFQQTFGLTLKAYCNILRFRAALPDLKAGRLFPEQHFADQAHFIREIKKYAGVVPKELARNQNDRFIQFAALPKK